MKHKEHIWSVAFHIEKAVFLLLALVLLTVFGTKPTIAVLTAAADPITNTFDAGAVACLVNSDYSVTNKAGNTSNTGTITDAYIRAAVIVNWEKESGSVIYGTPPKVTFDTGTGWIERDGYYYYASKVSADSSTTPLISSLTCDDAAPDGYSLTIRIIAEAIQAEGVIGTQKAAEEAWGLPAGILQ